METFFLACFAIGLLFTLASLALGFVGGGLGHGAGHIGGHVPHAGHIGGGAPHVGVHAPHVGGHDVHLPQGSHEGTSQQGSSLPLLNGSSAVGGLTWFGAAGYLLVRLGDFSLPLALLGGLAAGALGWYLVARFLGLILRGEVEMNPEDYRLEGTVGQVTVSIPVGGTGEILFEKAGVRRSEAARALGGTAIPRGTEVVIASYDRGFATVQPWTEFIAEHDGQSRLTARNREA